MRKRWPANVGLSERVVRVLVGAIATVSGVALLPSAVMVSTAMLEVIAVALGLYGVLTGVIGYCPFYRQFGHFSLLRRPKTTRRR